MGASEKSAATFHPDDRPAGEVPPRFLYRDPTKPDPYQALLTQLHEVKTREAALRAGIEKHLAMLRRIPLSSTGDMTISRLQRLLDGEVRP